jgi:Fic family protein
MLTKLPIKRDFKNTKIFEKLIIAHKALANLRGTSKIIPNQSIIINSLALQEAKDSSEIENIITTHDELYKSSLNKNSISSEVKEVQNYKEALLVGFNIVKDTELLLIKDILKIQEVLE